MLNETRKCLYGIGIVLLTASAAGQQLWLAAGERKTDRRTSGRVSAAQPEQWSYHPGPGPGWDDLVHRVQR